MPPTDFDTQAHENPTYMTAKEIQSVRRNITIPPCGTTVVYDKSLPEKPDALPEEFASEAYMCYEPDVAVVTGQEAAQRGKPVRTGLTSDHRATANDSVEVREADTEKLMDNEQIVVSLDSISTTQSVSYSPKNTPEKKWTLLPTRSQVMEQPHATGALMYQSESIKQTT